MNKTDTNFISFSLLVLSFIVLIFNIELGEVQPWDEGLYAYRARAILESNQWWDQSSVSLGGLYSSTYPPLVPWMIALNLQIFGENLFAIRIFSVLCSTFAIFLFVFFLSKQFDYLITFLVGLNLLLSSHWLFYSRQGMTDIPLLFFILSNIIVTVKFLEEQYKTKQLVLGLLISFTFFLGLMTKIVLSFIPLLTLIFVYRYFPKKIFLKTLIFYALGLLLAMPWYFFMSMKYGTTFISSLFPPHLFSIVEENRKSLGFFYYINQILISNPFLVLSFFSIFIRFKSKKFRNLFFSGNIVSDIFFFWFLSGLLIFSLAPTKLPHYTLYLLPPAFFLICELISLHYNNLKLKEKTFLIIAVLFNLFWFFTPSFRQSIKEMNFETPIISIALLLVAISIIGFIYFQERKRKIDFLSSQQLITTLFYIISSLLLVLSIINFASNPTGKVFGGERVSKFLMNHKIESFVYLFHKANDSDTLNPQIAWYSHGKYFGINKSKGTVFLALPINKIGLNELKQLQKYPNFVVVYYISSPKLPAKIIVDELIPERDILLLTPNYIIFGRKVRESKEINKKLI